MIAATRPPAEALSTLKVIIIEYQSFIIDINLQRCIALAEHC
jgi:hypothetical protein